MHSRFDTESKIAVTQAADIARELRYQTESGALVVVAIGLALMPLVGAREVNTERPEVPRPYETPRYVVAGVLA